MKSKDQISLEEAVNQVYSKLLREEKEDHKSENDEEEDKKHDSESDEEEDKEDDDDDEHGNEGDEEENCVFTPEQLEKFENQLAVVRNAEGTESYDRECKILKDLIGDDEEDYNGHDDQMNSEEDPLAGMGHGNDENHDGNYGNDSYGESLSFAYDQILISEAKKTLTGKKKEDFLKRFKKSPKKEDKKKMDKKKTLSKSKKYK